MLAITGAAGFIGSHLAHRLAGQGHDLVLVDHPLVPAKRLNLEGLPQHRSLGHESFVDWLNHEQPVLHGIFHLGACSATTETDWHYLLRNNVEYSQRLWRWCVHAGTPFIYASSAATYGDGTFGFDDRLPPARLRPLNLYGKSKNDFDAWVLDQASTPPHWAGVKFFNVYGPRETHKGPMASVVWQAFRQVRATGAMRLFRSNVPGVADGAQQRDFVFVEDCVDHLLWLWQKPTGTGLFNSGTGQARTFLDLARAVFAALDRPAQIDFIDMPAALAGQYQSFTQADVSRLRSLGYERRPTCLEDGVRQTIAGYHQLIPDL